MSSAGEGLAVSRYRDLAALPGDYALLFEKAGNTSVFFTLPWFRNFIGARMVGEDDLRIYAVHAAGKPCALALMRHARAGAVPLAARSLVGLSNYYTSLFGPIVDPRSPNLQETLDTLAAALVADEPRWDTIDFHPLATDTPVYESLIAALRGAGLLVDTYFCFGNWYLQVRGRSYAEYFKSLPSQLKNTVKRKGKQLESSGNAKIVIAHDKDELEEALRAYEQVYASSWKQAEPYPEFIRGLCRTSAESGSLRLGAVYLDNQPIAAQIWIVHGGAALIYKLSYDERYAKLSAGSILTSRLMQHVIDVDKVREVDYLTGDDAYKKDWMSDRRERRGVIAFNRRTPRGLLAAARHQAGKMANRILRRR